MIVKIWAYAPLGCLAWNEISQALQILACPFREDSDPGHSGQQPSKESQSSNCIQILGVVFVFHSPYWLTRSLGTHAPGAIYCMCLSLWFHSPCQLLRLPWSHIWWPPLMPPHFPSPLLFIQSAVQKSSFPVLHLLSTEESPNSLASLGSRLCPRHCVTSSREWQNMKL